MRYSLLVLAVALFCMMKLNTSLAQSHELRIHVVSSSDNSPLPGASVNVKSTQIGAVADSSGIVRLNLETNSAILTVRFVGFEARNIDWKSPETELTVTLSPDEAELEEVIVTTTRTSRTIRSIPTRVEFIGAGELEEKITMQPGNIRMVLSESTGIQTQQTSVASANATIRIQGLDGRYTQLLRDGFPLYGNFSGGLSILQVPPLDLRQVDVIKGSASTLYGGGAIAGLVNLVSRQPVEKPELTLFANGTSARGLDLSTYYSQKFKKTGYTFLLSRNSNDAYDPSNEGFSAIPNFTRYTINPKIFVYPNAESQLTVGLNSTVEKRIGGDMQYLSGNGDAVHSFYEQNKTQRYSSQISYDRAFEKGRKFNVKNSLNYFSRDINQRDYFFGGKQLSSFSEVSYSNDNNISSWTTGLNLWTDSFDEDKQAGLDPRDFTSITYGYFVQNLSDFNDHLSLESGLRIDKSLVRAEGYGSLSKWNFLPRVSLLVKWNRAWTSRIGGGAGYKIPSIFTEKAEEQVFHNVRPIVFSQMKNETSWGANADVNFQTLIGTDLNISINQMVFYTLLRDPLSFNPDLLDQGIYFFENNKKATHAAGLETNLKVEYDAIKLFLGYTFVDALSGTGNGRITLPLTARNRINTVLLYEVEDSYRLGFEAFYYSRQQLSTGDQSPSYWLIGFSAQKKWEHLSVFVNFENFTDTRQTRFGPVNTGTITNPIFSEIYAPLDGFVFNGGVLYSF